MERMTIRVYRLTDAAIQPSSDIELSTTVDMHHVHMSRAEYNRSQGLLLHEEATGKRADDSADDA